MNCACGGGWRASRRRRQVGKASRLEGTLFSSQAGAKKRRAFAIQVGMSVPRAASGQQAGKSENRHRAAARAGRRLAPLAPRFGKIFNRRPEFGCQKRRREAGGHLSFFARLSGRPLGRPHARPAARLPLALSNFLISQIPTSTFAPLICGQFGMRAPVFARSFESAHSQPPVDSGAPGDGVQPSSRLIYCPPLLLGIMGTERPKRAEPLLAAH